MIGLTFSKNIKSGVASGKMSADEVVTSLASGLSTTTFDPLAIAHIIHGSMKMPLSASIGLAGLSEISEITTYIEENLDVNTEKISKNTEVLSSVKGFESFDETVKTLMSYADNNTVAVSSQLSTFVSEAKATNDEGIALDYDMIIIEALAIDNKGTELLKKKSDRLLKTKGLKESAPDFWTPFLSSYFPGMSGIGNEFAIWTKNKFYSALIDNTETMGGFIYDINDAINKIKKEASDMVLNSVVSYDTTELTSAVLNNSEDMKTKYFYEVLATDFDFILNNMIKSITVSAKETKASNSVVSGFVAENGEVLNTKVLNIENIKHLFTKAKANNFSIAGATTYGAAIPNILNKVDYDSHSFEAAEELTKNAFYFTTIDEKFFYRDSKGNNTDITPIPFYSYNSASKRNENSFDPFVGALDSDSKFIHNLFQMFKMIKKDTGDSLIYGDRLTVIDFLTVAPYLTNAGKSIEEFIPSLTELASLDTPAGRIANTLLVNVFSPVATRMSDNQDIFSIYQAVKNTRNRTSINHQIIKALHSALINKDNIRYLKVEENITSITRGLDSGSASKTVNTELAGLLTTDGYTKHNIAKTITVVGDRVSLSNGIGEESIALSDINNMNIARKASFVVGLHTEFKKIHDKFSSVFPVDKANASTISVLVNLIAVAAVNKKDNPLKTSISDSRIFEHPNYIVLPPSSFILGEELEVLASLYNVDSHKSISVGGSLTASTSTPNRDSAIPKQIVNYEHYNNFVNAVKFTFNPFLSAVSADIPKANYLGQVLKTPMVVSGEAIKLSSWDVKVRVEHAMVQGFMQAPKNIGREFYVQPINYSDKSNIPLQRVEVDSDNLLEPGEKMKEKLIKAFIEYQVLKNEELQRVTLHHLKEFVVGNFDNLILSFSSSADSAKRKEALYKLRAALLSDFSTRQGDMTREINVLMADVRINPNTIKFSNSELDAGADYVTFSGNPNSAIIKPHLGIRAALYRDPVKARREVLSLLTSHRQSIEKLNMSADKIEAELLKASKKDNTPSIVDSAEEFYDRFFLINGIYGHAIKTLTMGDESYFSAKYPKGMTVDKYYTQVDNGDRIGIEEVEKMLVAQFKRAQSELTRGNIYTQKGTLEGLKRKHRKDNILSHLSIYGDNVVLEEGDTRKTINNTYDFEALKGKTLSELEGMGIISRFDNGDLISENGSGILVKYNVGSDQIIIGDYRTSVYDLKDSKVDPQLVEGLFELVKANIQNTRNSPSEIDVAPGDIVSEAASSIYNESEFLADVGTDKQYQKYTDSILDAEDNPIPGTEEDAAKFKVFKSRQSLMVEKSSMTHGIIKNVEGREHALTLDTYLKEVSKINNDVMLVMPDLIPSITISDPVSSVNLLNSMGNNQENSDAIQFIHPLMSLIMKEARGGVLGAFNTENSEALKLLTTTFEYDRMRQVLQKKSVQMPFSDEQMKKLGSIELYNTFKKMNTAIKFKKPIMSFFETVSDRDTVSTYEANNLHELYYAVMKKLSTTKVDAGHEVPDTIVWRRVMEILRQNPINLYSFVGLVSVPSNQKTGHKKLNKYDSVFSKVENNDVPNIDYTANEFNYEVLTKAHSYDVTGELHEASTLTLLSQIVNAVSFGGLSNLTTKNLQNAMGGRMAINSLRVGKDLANIATKFKEDDEYPDRFNKIISRLSKGIVSTNNLKPEEIDAFNIVIRAGVYEMANLAFQKSDSLLMHKIVKGENMKIDADGNVVTDTGVYSMDSPAVRAKVMGTLRSAFFEDTVKMKMSGFIGTVSASHKTINIFSLADGRRVGRSAYIKAGLEQGLTKEDEGKTVIISEVNYREVQSQILPFDDVHVTRKGITSTMRFGSVPVEYFLDPKILVVGVLTPDVLYSATLDAKKYDDLDENTLLKIIEEGSGEETIHFKWYLQETMSTDKILSLIESNQLQEDITEKYSLRWYDYTKTTASGEIVNIKSTDAYRKFYRDTINEVSEEALNAARALLILETQEKAEDGSNIWSASTPEVVLPTFMGNAFGIPKGMSLADIIGTNGSSEVNAAAYFNALPKTEATFTLLTGTIVHHVDQLIRIYSRKMVIENNTFDQAVLDYLKKIDVSAGTSLQSVDREAINTIITAARRQHTNGMAKDFLASLEVALTRIPGQSKQSAFMGNVIELLDAQGNATFAPTDHLVNTGGDMDIDTLSVLTKTIDTNGRMFDFSQFITDDKGFSIENMTLQYEKDLEFAEERILNLIDESNKRSEEYIKNREAKLLTQKTPGMIQEVSRQLGYAKNLPFTKENIDVILSQTRKKVFAKYENLLANAIADGVFRALDNVDSSVELNTPISMGMFKAIIKRIEDYNEKNNNVNTTVSVRRDYNWAELKDAAVYSARGVNVMNTSKKTAEHEHFGNPFSGTGAAGLIHVGKHLMTREEYSLPENEEKRNENIKIASEMYSAWLAAGKTESLFEEINGYTLNLVDVAPQQKAWIKQQIASGKLDNVTLLEMRESGSTITHSSVLAGIIGTRLQGPRSGEDYRVIFEYENLNAQGKEAIGIFATTLKINSAMQSAKINYDTNYKHSGRTSYENPFFFKNSITYVDFETNETVERSRSGFADLDRFNISLSISKSTALQKTIAKIVTGRSDFNVTNVNTLTNLLSLELKNTLEMSELRPDGEEANELLASLAKSLFNIVLDKNAGIKGFRDLLTNNPKLVGRAYIEVIGKQLSNDAQSQFLSAATDNAKELILGKIKSNQLTNPILTALMILGYDTKTTIDFLYDPSIAKVLDRFSDKVSNLEKVSITASKIKEEGFDMFDPAIISLVSVIEIGEEIAKFRSIRSLNENSQIEQYKLDSILEKLDADLLYKAIKTDNIDLLVAKNDAQEVFNPNLMVFLHPQSRYLFTSVYESERYKMTALFKVVKLYSNMAGDSSKNMAAYKNMSYYISQFQVDRYLNTSKTITNSKGEERQVFKTGTVITMDPEKGAISKEYTLNDPSNRALFVKSFETYIEYAKERIEAIQGSENAALSNLGRDNTFNSTNPVYYFPKLKNNNIDSLDLSLIYEGINELKIKTGNAELDALQRSIYTNLSYYALIVSSGEIKKSSMIEAFEEINLGLSAFLQTLTQEDYNKAVPDTPFVVSLIKGEVLFRDALIKKRLKDFENRKSLGEKELESELNEQFQDAAYEEPDEAIMEDLEDEYDMEDEEFRKKSKKRNLNAQSEAVRTIFVGSKTTNNNIFKILDPALAGDIFYAFRTGEIAYRIFPSEASEALPVTTIPSIIDYKNLDKDVVRELNMIGMQFGMSATYDGKPIRVLAYKGLEGISEQYIVAHNNGTMSIPGAHIMEENPELLLMGNIIQKVSSKNRYKSIDKAQWNKNNIAKIPRVMKSLDTSVNIAINGLFTQEDIFSDFIVSRESRILGAKGGAYDVLSLKEPKKVDYTPSYKSYLESPLVKKSNKGSRSTLIPAIYTDISYGSLVDEDIVSEMMSQVVDILNNTDIGEEVNLFGISNGIDFNGNKNRVPVGGMDLLDRFLSPYKIKRTDGTISVLNSSFEYTKVYDQPSDTYKVVLKRVKSNGGLVMINKTITNVVSVKDPETGFTRSKEWLGDQVKVKALVNGLIQAPYKAFYSGIKNKRVEVVAIRTGEGTGDYEMYYKESLNGFNDKYIKLHSTLDKDGIFDSEGNNLFMLKSKYDAILANTENEKNNLINPGC